MTYQVHLNKSGFGMSVKTACGRNILRAHISTSWNEFKSAQRRCAKCEQSKQFALNTRADIAKVTP